MTLQSDGNTIWVRCASDDGTVGRFEVDHSNITMMLDCAEAGEEFDPPRCVIIPKAEAMMLGHWLLAAARGEVAE